LEQKRYKNDKFLKLRKIYDQKKKNRDKIIISFGDGDEEEDNSRKEDTPQKELIEGDSKSIKHLKRLKKNTDNKEMELPLDTECIICCDYIKELANPDGCNHNFCKDCLIQWSLRSSKCPMCKNPYFNVFTYDTGSKNQITINEIRNKYKKEKKDDNENDNNIQKLCYICGKSSNSRKLISCDRCESNFCHTYCLKKEKKERKEGKWICEFCQEEIKERREIKKKIGQFFL
jgi:hypothetical protein